MAEVYLCSSVGPEGFEKEVVIKRIRSVLASDRNFVEMFIAEAQLASKLNHANIVQIFDFDKHEDTYYLAMEYVRGHSLAEAHSRGRELFISPSPVLAAHIAAEVARGLHHAHSLRNKGQSLGIVHRDVTPHNVLLSFDGAVKLADFGIAKAGNKLTVPGMLKGKFAYMSPEQARGDEIDHRTDIFALGVVLWEMLTGARLFDGDSDVAVLRAVQERLIPPPARLNPEVPPDLDAIVMRALERKPDERFQTAQLMEHQLARFVIRRTAGPEDTDVGAYLRRLFSDEPTSVVVAPSSVRSSSAPKAAMGETVSLKGAATSAPAKVLPDEDVNAETFVVSRHERSTEPALVPPVPAPSPAPPPPATEPPVASALKPAAPTNPREDTSVSPRRPSWRWLAGGGALAALAAMAFTLVSAGRDDAPSDSPTEAPSTPAEEKPGPAPQEKLVAARPEAPSAKSTETAGAVVPDTPSPQGPVAPDLRQEARESTRHSHGADEEVAAEKSAHTGVSRPAAEVAATEPARSSPPPVKRASEMRPRENGTLVLHVLPYARVSIDGESIGDVEGTRRLSLPAGRHRIHFEHPKRTKTAVVTVEPGRETEYKFQSK